MTFSQTITESMQTMPGTSLAKQAPESKSTPEQFKGARPARPGRSLVRSAGIFFGNVKSFMSRVFTPDSYRRSRLNEATRNQCRKLMKLLDHPSGDKNLEKYNKRLFLALLPGMQALAKKSQNDFDLYQALLKKAPGIYDMEQDLTKRAPLIDPGKMTPSEMLGFLRGFKDWGEQKIKDFKALDPKKYVDELNRLPDKFKVGEAKKLLDAFLKTGKKDTDKSILAGKLMHALMDNRRSLLTGRVRDKLMDNLCRPSKDLLEWTGFERRDPKLPDPDYDAYKTALDAYKSAQKEDKNTLAGKLAKAFARMVSGRMKEALETYRPRSTSERQLKRTLLEKYKTVGLEGMTERDFEKMGRLLGRQAGVKSVLNLAVMARFVLKDGHIKPTEYVSQQAKTNIKKALGKEKLLPKDLTELRKMVQSMNTKPVNTVEELTYLKNKVAKKIRDHVLAMGDGHETNELNKSIIKALERNIFIAPEGLKYEMLGTIKKIGKGGGGTAFLTGTLDQMIKKVEEKEDNTYKLVTHQLNELTRTVNKSQAFVFKVFQPTLLSETEHLEGFKKEKEIIEKLAHPNIVNTYFSITALKENRVGYVMDYCEKGDFQQVLKKEPKQKENEIVMDYGLEKDFEPVLGKEPKQKEHKIVMDYSLKKDFEQGYDPGTSHGVKNIARILLGALEGMHHMHRNGLVHRDIKMENIFVTRDNIPKLGDFGLSKQIGTTLEGLTPEELKDFKYDEDVTKRIGTGIYMAPEITLGTRLGPSSDYYSLGMTALLAMVKGNTNELFKKQFNVEFIMSKEENAGRLIIGWLEKSVFTNKDVPEAEKMKNLIQGLLHYDPDKRIGYTQCKKILEGIIKPAK